MKVENPGTGDVPARVRLSTTRVVNRGIDVAAAFH